MSQGSCRTSPARPGEPWIKWGQNIESDKGEMIDLGAVSQDTGFNTLAGSPRDGAHLLPGWLLEARNQPWTPPNEGQMPE